jgi:hypothetical protein
VSPVLAVWLADLPKQMLEIFDRVALEVALDIFPGYTNVNEAVFVRVTDLPISDAIRDLRRARLAPRNSFAGICLVNRLDWTDRQTPTLPVTPCHVGHRKRGQPKSTPFCRQQAGQPSCDAPPVACAGTTT